ncbi:MAG: TIR domain-containing protein [Hyphomonadaceae bacterium]|nr:TIR domain-containing protein [Hyphomonadaceae bacterium]
MAGEIFISYRRADQAKARLLHALLKQRGVDAWYDALLGAGEDWRHKTASALEAAPIFVLLFSKTASESDDISKELAAATFSKKLVIPVRIENIKPSGAFLYELASRNWVDAYEDTEAKFEDLADKLAALVKGGPAAEVAAFNLGAPGAAPKVKSASTPLFKRPAVLAGFAAVAVAVVASAGFVLTRPSAAPVGAGAYRTAFFGFAAVGDDPAAATAAGMATEEGFRLLERVNVETVPRIETAGAQDAPMLERAGELGARFALSGEIRREGDELKAVVRLVDVSNRTTIAQMSGARDADKPSQVGYDAGAFAARLPRCVQTYAASDTGGAPDAEALALMGRACATDLNGAPTSFRELMQGRPKNWMAPGMLADALMWKVGQLPQTQRPAALSEAEDLLKRAEEMAPEAYSTAIARVSLAVVSNRPPAEWLSQLEPVLTRAPSTDEAPTYGRASAIAGQQLLEVGRTEDAARYFALAVTSDPLSANWEYYQAVARAASGQYGAKESLDRLVETRVSGYSWEVAMAAAIFLGATDPEIVFAATPPGAMEAVPCYRELIASLKLTDRQARLAGAKKADVCLTSFDSPHVNIQAQSMLGDLDRAFAIADRQDFTAFMWTYWSPLFLPSTKAMRADARFLPMVERLGFVDYWKQTKTQPDVCGTPEERDFPVCVVLR